MRGDQPSHLVATLRVSSLNSTFGSATDPRCGLARCRGSRGDRHPSAREDALFPSVDRGTPRRSSRKLCTANLACTCRIDTGEVVTPLRSLERQGLCRVSGLKCRRVWHSQDSVNGLLAPPRCSGPRPRQGNANSSPPLRIRLVEGEHCCLRGSSLELGFSGCVKISGL